METGFSASASATVADLDGDGKKEVVIYGHGDESSGFITTVTVLDDRGYTKPGWPRTLPGENNPGFFQYNHPPVGTYTLKATYKGGLSYTQSNVQITANTTTVINFTLSKTGGKPRK